MKLYFGFLLLCGFGCTWTGAQFQNSLSRRCFNPNRRPGTCVSIYDCQTLLSVLQRRPLQQPDVDFVRASQCSDGFGTGPYVCCTGDTGFERLAATDTLSPSTLLFPAADTSFGRGQLHRGSKATRATDSSPTLAQLSLPPSCGGVTISNKIYSGTDTDLYEFPWLVRLEYNRRSGGVTKNCAGSLINQRYVVTAAHCVTGAITRRIGPLVAVRLGEYDSTKDTDCDRYSCAPPALRLGIDEAIPHELYREANANKEHDIALIRLDRDILYSDSVRPICLPSAVRPEREQPRGGTLYTVAGWGRTLRSPQSAVKQKLTVPLVEQEQCRRLYLQRRVNIVDGHICAGGVYGEDSCDGDSGGPLMRFYGGAWVLEGVISFGYKCGLRDWPAVHTRVVNYDSWIRSNMRS